MEEREFNNNSDNVEFIKKQVATTFTEVKASINENLVTSINSLLTLYQSREKDFKEYLELLKEYSDTNKKIEEITNISDINKISEKISDELKKAENLKEELSKNIAEAEKTLNEKQKEVLDEAAKGRAFLNFWNGVSYDA